MEQLLNLDSQLFIILNSIFANSFLDKFFPFITDVSNWLLVYIIGILVLIFKGGKTGRITALALIITILITDQAVSSYIKDYVGRLRPCHVLENIRLLVNCGGGKSFPSAHAANNFAAAVVITFFYKKNKWIFYLIASLMAFSRVYIGVHYPLDIIAGGIIGAVIGYLIAFSINKIFNKKLIERPK